MSSAIRLYLSSLARAKETSEKERLPFWEGTRKATVSALLFTGPREGQSPIATFYVDALKRKGSLPAWAETPSLEAR